jgi:ubiquinone/menaquinone biosynthesis C-methylase UbiE/uncharacterized protein YbaR (Trm112 family)
MLYLQTNLNKNAEVKFRQQLIKQHTGNKIIFPNEPDFGENLKSTENRLEYTRNIWKKLRQQQISLSPFLEIAGGNGLRSDLLASEFAAKGITSDISQHTQTGGIVLRAKFGLNKQSLRICCDAYNLPFLSDSFSFVFIALSLHHFPDPKPIIKEAARVLQSNGYFYFDEEPIAQLFNLNLWRRPNKLRWFEKILKASIILLFLSRIGKTEVDYGILEETFTLQQWEKALAPFHSGWVEESVFPFNKYWKTICYKKNTGWVNPNLFTRLGLVVFGGGIKGLLQIKKIAKQSKFQHVIDFLACPSCRKNDELNQLLNYGKYLICRKCHIKYFQKQNVWMLLEPKLYKQLYG